MWKIKQFFYCIIYLPVKFISDKFIHVKFLLFWNIPIRLSSLTQIEEIETNGICNKLEKIVSQVEIRD